MKKAKIKKDIIKLTKDERLYLELILVDYLHIFKKTKAHQKAHKKTPCSFCENARKILKKLKKQKILNNP